MEFKDENFRTKNVYDNSTHTDFDYSKVWGMRGKKTYLKYQTAHHFHSITAIFFHRLL